LLPPSHRHIVAIAIVADVVTNVAKAVRTTTRR
jgi:hypothetical protein